MANKEIPTTPFLKLTTDPENISYDVKRVNENSKKIDTFANNIDKTVGVNKVDADKKIASLEERKINKSDIGDSLIGVAKKEDIDELETHIDNTRVGENILINSKKLEADGWSGILNTTGNILLGELPLSDVYTRYGDFNIQNYMLTFSCDLQIVEQTISGDWEYCLMGFANLYQDNQRTYFQEFKPLGKLGGRSFTKIIINIPLGYKNPYDEKIKLIGFFIARGGEQIQYKIKNIKLEVGEKATPYIPSIHDSEGKIDALKDDLIDQATETAKRFDVIDNKELVLEKISTLIKTTVTSDGAYIKDRLTILERGMNSIIAAVKINSNKLDKLDKLEKLIEAENLKFSKSNTQLDKIIKG